MYKGINSIRKGFQSRSPLMKDENGNIISGENELIKGWGKYFNDLLNVNNDCTESESDIHTAELNVEEPSFREVRDALRKLKIIRQRAMTLYRQNCLNLGAQNSPAKFTD